MGETALKALAAVLAALVIGLALLWHPELPEKPLQAAASPAGGDFSLASASGPVKLSDFRGRVVIVYFGYTYCPDVCPTALAAIGAGLRLLSGDEAARVAVVFISVDPERDSPERLKDYAGFFHPAIVGVTGNAAELAAIASRYGAFYAKQKVATAGGGYVVDHTADAFVVDPGGRLVGRIAHATAPEGVAAIIRQYLKQP
ncbi:MAG: SCO family protein [Betaproteobacteria bacterium]|nr:SCO family protein [Betaproteobacteria bacterium]